MNLRAFSKATLILMLWLALAGNAHAQQPPSTAIPISLPSATPTGVPSPTPTHTPTSAGPGIIEAVNAETNVRAQPDIDAQRVGQIFPGQKYVVVAKRFEWFQIRYPETPGGIGWVHNSVVTFTGNLDEVPELGVEQVPTEDPAIGAARETLIAISATPGAIPTMTAMARITPTGVFEVPPAASLNPDGSAGIFEPGAEILPTFTFPPFTPTPIALQELSGQTAVAVQEEPLPPIAPIAGLVGLGLIGLLISILRRV